MKNKNKAVWGIRFKNSTSKIFEQFGASIDIDKRLFEEDIFGLPPNIDNSDIVNILILDVRDNFVGSGSYIAGYFDQNDQSWGKWKVGLHEQISLQLAAVGIPEENIQTSDMCTYESQDCHSYRRDGENAGRMFAFLELKH